MKNVTDKDKQFNVEAVFNAEGVIANEGVFNAIVDYLNDMLASPPNMNNMNLNLGEIRFVHKTADDYSKPVDTSGTVIDKVINIEADRTKLEVNMLRDENDDLKLKIARLVAQLNDIECSYEAVLNENKHLKSTTDYLQSELENLKTSAMSTTLQVQDESAFISDQTPEIINISEEDSVPVQTASNVATLPDEDDDLTDEEQQKILVPEIAEETIPEPPVAEDECHPVKEFYPGVAEDKAIISRPHIATENVTNKTKPDFAVFSQKRFAIDKSIQRSNSTSKIIKCDPATKHTSANKTEPVLETTPDNFIVKQDWISHEINTDSDRIQPQNVIEQENIPEADQNSNRDLLAIVNTDESSLGPAPAPKTDVRKHLKNYKAIQDSSDPTIPNSGHNIIL